MLSDGNQDVIYTNHLGQDILSIRKQGTSEWKGYKQHGSAGRTISEATPSTVVSYNGAQMNLGVALQPSSGIIHLTNYASVTTATTTAPGNVAGYVTSRQVKQGTGGIPDTTESATYIRHDATVFGVTRTVFPLAALTLYEGQAGAGPLTTSYSYTWKTPAGGTGESNKVDQKTTTYPIVTTGKNGSNVATSEIQAYDKWGQPTWIKDGEGFIHCTEYDRGTAAVTKRIVDVNTALAWDLTGLPVGWTTPAGGGLHLKTLQDFDLLARTTKVTAPRGDVTHMVYKDSNWETRVYPGWTGTATTGPTRMSRRDKLGNYSESLTMTATPAVASGKPAGAEVVSGVVNITRDFSDDSQRLDHSDSYFNVSGLAYTTLTSYGTLGTNFLRESHAYDVKGRPQKTTDSTGTIRKKVWDGRDRVVSEWIGTTEANLIQTMGYEYDGNAIGNDTLTKSKFFTSAAISLDTAHQYDFRDRPIQSRGPDKVAMKQTLDNLGQVLTLETYADANGDFVIGAGELRGKSESKFDEKRQLYRTIAHHVDPATGVIGNRLTTNIWSNARGMGVKTRGPNGEFRKSQYDGAGRPMASFTSYDDSETTYAQALDVAGDTVIEELVPSYDANSNTLQATSYERTNSSSKTGSLSVGWGETDSRRSYTASWFDVVNRMTSFVDYGRNGGVALVRPVSPPAPNTSDLYLVTKVEHDPGGRQHRTTDNKGRIAEQTFDALDRVTRIVENRVDGIATETESDTDRTTERVFDSVGRFSRLIAHNPKGLGQGVVPRAEIFA
jgi:hypothetical protein